MDLSSTFFVFPVVVSALGLLAVIFQVKNSKPGSRNPLTAFGYVFVALALVGAAGSGAYAWNAEQSFQTAQAERISEIAGLRSQLDLAADRDSNLDTTVSELKDRVETQSRFIIELKAINAALVEGNESLSGKLTTQSQYQQQAMRDQQYELKRQTRALEDQNDMIEHQERQRQNCNFFRRLNSGYVPYDC